MTLIQVGMALHYFFTPLIHQPGYPGLGKNLPQSAKGRKAEDDIPDPAGLNQGNAPDSFQEGTGGL